MAATADCKQQLKQTVFPVFYDVDPSDLRSQCGVYQNDFDLHRRKKFKHDPDKIRRWERAMTDLANSVGWDVRNKPESEEIESIVQAVIKKLGHKFSSFASDLIGIQSRVQTLENILRLSLKNDDVLLLGIWGMGGIGKTTQAAVLYDKISHKFDACCFIENVSKIYRDGGHTAIQKQILRQTLQEKNLEMYSPFEISGIVRNRLHNIKVLIVLDDVDQIEQLQELAINPKFLFKGSRVIVTTKDEHILKPHGNRVLHKVSLLNENEARELFFRKAFKNEDQSSSCVELIPEVLKYVQCLPLAIKVMGSFLCTRDAIQWRDALDRLKTNPNDEIMNVLEISLDGLEYEEKEIFLHIACFFKGEREDYVKRILECCGLHPHIGIPRIIEKSLITIRDQEIHMHDMFQELGKKIIRNRFPEEPGSWSRIWRYEDFDQVLMVETVTKSFNTFRFGTNNVKAIVLDKKEDILECRVDVLSRMKDLRLLILYHQNFSGSLDSLSHMLRYLLWHSYPFDSLPSNFTAAHIVELNMPNSSIKRVWEGRKQFPSLKRMDLSNSKCLVETPVFFGTPKLERLDLSGCISLLHVHPSLGSLGKLTFLSLRNCTNLVSIDFGNGSNLSSLTVLHLSGCTKLECTPNFTRAKNLKYLDFDGCASLSMVHESIGALSRLTFLSLRNCENLVSIPNNINAMRSLQTLDLGGCLKLDDLPEPCHFRCGCDIVFPWDMEVIPRWFKNEFASCSIMRIKDFNMNDDWLGFAFYVTFKVNNPPSPDCSLSSSVRHPFYLSFESEHTEEYFDMPLDLKMEKIDKSEYIWVIYISRQHCHFVKTGAHITFKAHSGIEISKWGMRSIFRDDLEGLKRKAESEGDFHDTSQHSVAFDDVTNSITNPGAKILLPYNWLVTDEDEVENIEAKAKEISLSNVGL
uniref:TMV resistance protein N n=1 Tax=Cajanus cajan TaxID=3821 RepID=A0A151RL11_CAJCA|nr:TMV resistance protein N [Cajanus cajan]